MSEKFNLKWNDFHTNVSKSFALLRNESYLQDVTLISEDFKHIPAHKLVLSACSEYFKRLFQETKQTQPLICLDGVTSADLKNVLDYVYDGEVKILQEDLDRFLNVANKLKLEGLIGNGENGHEAEESENSLNSPADSTTIDETFEREEEVKPTQYSNPPPPRKPAPRSVVSISNEAESVINQTYDENVAENPDRSLSCKICGKVSQKFMCTSSSST